MPNLLQTLATSLAGSLLICAAGQSLADEAPRGDGSRAGILGGTVQDELASVGVKIDFARVLSFPEPARTIIIGNPGIVDGVLSDEHTIVLTGKATGVTNLIVLGEGGREVLKSVVSVTPSSYQTTTIYSGASLRTFSCSGSCKPVLSVGDDSLHFDRTRDQIRGRQDFLGASAAPPSVPPQKSPSQ